MKLIICILGLTATALAGEDELSATLKQANDQFTSQMFYQVAKENTGKSVILSAFSVMPALAQLSQASLGTSHDEILKAICLPNDNVTTAVFTSVNKKVRSVNGPELRTASRIYVAQDAQLNKQFAAITKDVFNSDVKNVDFSKSKETSNEINAWVEAQTNNKIKDLVSPDSLDSTTRVVLVNAIYFKGSWKNKFDKQLTNESAFHVSKDKTINVPTMYKKDDFRYAESTELDAKLLEIPYEGEESSMVFVLPNEKDGMTALTEKLADVSLLSKAVQQMSTHEVDVKLPRFKIETKTNLKTILQKMNVTKLFIGAEARLDNLLEKESNLYVTDAIQKAFIEVNEDGAEAAAANEFGISYLSAIIKDTRSFTADHPFAFYLREGANILFSGVFQS